VGWLVDFELIDVGRLGWDDGGYHPLISTTPGLAGSRFVCGHVFVVLAVLVTQQMAEALFHQAA